MTRDERQDGIVVETIQKGVRCYVEACTGFGKTWIAKKLIDKFNLKNPNLPVHIVVPKIPLKLQHESFFKDYPNVEVFVVNTYTSEPRECAFLIADECHWYTNSNTMFFHRVFKDTKYKYILALSATLNRAQKEFLHSMNIFSSGFVSLEEARKNGWIAKYEIYNIPVEMTEDEKAMYEEKWGSDSSYNSLMSLFDFDLDLIIRCSFGVKPVKRYYGGNVFYPEPQSVKIAKRKGWRGNTPKVAYERFEANKSLPRGSKLDVWGNKDHPNSPEKLTGYASYLTKTIQERKKFIYEHPAKLEMTKKIFEKYQVKTISFSESIYFANMVANTIEGSVTYHSELETIETQELVEKSFITKSAAERFKTKVSGEIEKVDGKFIVRYNKPKKLGKGSLKKDALDKISNDENTLLLSTAKALDEGIDVECLEIGIISSRTSNPRQSIQRTGRIARLFVNGNEKSPKLFNIYLKNTKDEDWLRASLKKSVGYKWINSLNDVEEVFQFIS
jgi:superfamily II DNA or RNA helicase